MKIFLTGASGFIGSHILERLLERGDEVWCGIRSTTSLRYLQDPRVHIVRFDMNDSQSVITALQETVFDALIHAAGVTKCIHAHEYAHYNTAATECIIRGIEHVTQLYREQGNGMNGGPRLIYLSSLSAINCEPENKCGEPTMYGKSKFDAENILLKSSIRKVILRPTGVYGPRERDYLQMVKTLKSHIDFNAGFKPQHLTFVYVDDVVQAVTRCLDAEWQDIDGRIFALSDGETYMTQDFARLVTEQLTLLGGRKHWVVPLTVPLWVLKGVCRVCDLYGRLTGNIVLLNNDKYKILSQREWPCDISATRQILGYEPKVKLAEGVRRTVRWYKDNNWI